nr:transposase [Candidatus Chloroploca mongolica]
MERCLWLRLGQAGYAYDHCPDQPPRTPDLRRCAGCADGRDDRGALDARTGEMTVVPYCVADQLSTTDFLLTLHDRQRDVKLTICWDNASWHTCRAVKALLAEINAGREPEDWIITCLNFAPHAPEQNPIEEVWRQGKTDLRANPQNDATFEEFAARFVARLDEQKFDFAKLALYGDVRMI